MNSFLGQHSLSEKILDLEDTLTKKDVTDSQVRVFMKTKFSTLAHVHFIYINTPLPFNVILGRTHCVIYTVPDFIKFTYYDGSYTLIR